MLGVPARKPKQVLSVVRAEKARVLALQGAACAACQAAFKGTKDAHLDHCHATGKIRGVLCHACNTALGLLDDDIARLVQLAEYLSMHHLIVFGNRFSAGDRCNVRAF